MACPVVTTTVGAFGFPVQNGRQALIADDADSFAAALRELIRSETLRSDLGRRAREMISSEFDWARIGVELLNVVERRESSEDYRN